MNTDSLTRQKFPLVQRADYLKNLCGEKKVLHLGCTEHPFTAPAIQNKTHLHFDLQEIASELYGFDYDAEGLNVLREYNFGNLYQADLEKLDEVPLTEKFEVIVAGEMIEHLSNPGLFLRGIKRFMTSETNLVITTVNAYCGFRSFVYAFKNRGGSNEPVHPDHVAYYSYSTLRHVLERENLKVNKFAFYDVGRNHRPTMRWTQRLANDVCVRLTPVWADGIIAECSLG